MDDEKLPITHYTLPIFLSPSSSTSSLPLRAGEPSIAKIIFRGKPISLAGENECILILLWIENCVRATFSQGQLSLQNRVIHHCNGACRNNTGP